MDSFGKRLKELRNDKGITQKAMAEYLNISLPTLSHWECDYQEPAFKDLIMLSQFFNVTTDELLGLEDILEINVTNATGESASSERTRSEQERELLQCFRELSPYLQGVAVDTVRNWADRPDGGSLQNRTNNK